MPCESLDGFSKNWDPLKGTRRLPVSTILGRGVTRNLQSRELKVFCKLILIEYLRDKKAQL